MGFFNKSIKRTFPVKIFQKNFSFAEARTFASTFDWLQFVFENLFKSQKISSMRMVLRLLSNMLKKCFFLQFNLSLYTSLNDFKTISCCFSAR